jgi:hypothetical protein
MKLLDDRRGQTIGARFRKPPEASGQVRFTDRGSKVSGDHDADFESAITRPPNMRHQPHFVAPGR